MLGTSRVITTNTGAVCYDADFYPYGGERPYTNTCPQNYKFEGKERDTETGNDDFGARYYSNRFGRWLSADWSSVPVAVPYANLTNPQTLNLYAMVDDDPESFADLDGHENELLSRLKKAATNFADGMKQVGNAYKEAANAVVTVAKDTINTAGAGLGEVVGGIASGNNDELDAGVVKIGLAALPLLADSPEVPIEESTIEGAAARGEAATEQPAALPNEGIYEGPDANAPGKTYVGQSGDLPNRLQQHESSGKFPAGTKVSTTEVKGGRTAREVAEHNRIQQLGGVKSRPGSQTSNTRNPIGKARQHLLKKTDQK
jgi:RHS repeat-associated protein